MVDCKEIPEAETTSRRAAILQKMMDLSLFKDPIFMMYATSNFLTSIGFNAPYVFTMVSYIQSNIMCVVMVNISRIAVDS